MSGTVLSMIERRVCALVAGLTPMDFMGPVLPETRLDRLLFDSMGRIGLEVAVEEEFRVAVPEGAFADVETVSEVVSLVESFVRSKHSTGGNSPCQSIRF